MLHRSKYPFVCPSCFKKFRNKGEFCYHLRSCNSKSKTKPLPVKGGK